MTLNVIIDGTDVSKDIIHKSVQVKFLTEDEERYFGIGSVTLTLDNIDGVRNDMLRAEKRTGSVSLGAQKLLDIVVDHVSEDRDECTIGMTLMSIDREVLDDLREMRIQDNYRDHREVLDTLGEGGSAERIWTRVDKILETALSKLGLGLTWDIPQLGTSHMMVGGLSTYQAWGVYPWSWPAWPELIPSVPDWSVADLLLEVSQLFGAYWTIREGGLHIMALPRWQDLIGTRITAPFLRGTLTSESGESALSRVELTFANAMTGARQAPAQTSGFIENTSTGSQKKELTSKFAIPYALGYDYAGATPPGVAVIPVDIISNIFLMVSSGPTWQQQIARGASWYLSGYTTAINESGSAKAVASVMDAPDLIRSLSAPYAPIAIGGARGGLVCVKEATLDPHEETMDLTAGIYTMGPR